MTLPRPVRRATALLPVPLLAILLSGCAALGPNFTSPTAWWSPKSFTEAAPAQPSVTVAEPVDPQWWKLLGDPLLTAMEERLAKANLDVRVAALRVTEARAELGVTQAGGLPAVNADASYARVQQSRKGTQSLTSPTRLREPYDLFQYGFDATWELDFWGHVRRGVEQSAAQLTATEESGRDVMVTAEAELARAYVRLRGVQRKLQITRQNLESSRQSLQLTQARAAGGLTTDLDVANAAAQVATIQAEIPGLEQQQSEFGNALGLLLGEAPQALTVELAAPRAVPPVPPRVPVGV
ncbi:MAG: TolC family protein, partial [Rhodospirillales bacterium]|nr:TolC family protein [Rhodospirillales bacterium]